MVLPSKKHKSVFTLILYKNFIPLYTVRTLKFTLYINYIKKTLTFILPCILITLSLPINLSFAQTNEVDIIFTHLPPLQYDPELAKAERPGIAAEIWNLSNPKNAIRQNLIAYPPSRLYQMAAKNQLVGFSSVKILIKKYGLLEHYRCTGNLLETIPILYQNLRMDPKEMKNVKTELIGKNILLPKETRHFFQSIIPKGNNIFDINQPRNIAKMFLAQRQPYMIDYQSRAEAGLKLSSKIKFPIKRYVLMHLQTAVCITKNRPELFNSIMEQYWNFRKMKNTYEVNELEKKYDFKLNWGTDEDEWMGE